MKSLYLLFLSGYLGLSGTLFLVSLLKLTTPVDCRSDVSIRDATAINGTAGHRRILKGYPANEGEHPSYVMLVTFNDNKEVRYCGGAIVSNRHIITTVDCVSLDFGSTRAYSGYRKPTRLSQFNINIIKKCVSGMFNFRTKRNPAESNVAILRVAEDMNFDDRTGPVELNDRKVDYEDILKIVGLGVGEGGKEMKTLHQFTGYLTSCNDPQEALMSSYFCVKGYASKPCVGDEGGPVYAVRENKKVLAGLQSSPSSCEIDSENNFPVVDLFKLRWIVANLGKLC